MDPAFDALRTARDLEAAGLDRPQAEAVANAIRSGHVNLVTQPSLDASLSRLENRLTLPMIGIAALVIAAIKLIPAS